jgi:hypothetical protein
MAVTRQVIGDRSINTREFYDVTNAILDNLINNSTSPFQTVLDKFETYLSSIDNAEMDVVQKTTAYADFLKQVYTQINDKALGVALDLLKFNETAELNRVKTEAEVYAIDLNSQKTIEEIALTTATVAEKQKSVELAIVSIEVAKLNQLKTRAELVKNWGVKSTVSYSFGTDKYSPVTDTLTGDTYYYRVNSAGNFLKNAAAIATYNGANPLPAAQQVYGTTVTVTPKVDGEIFIQSGTLESDPVNTTSPGIVDQQIKGYDIVNLKDLLKTADERAALLSNAKIAETAGELSFREALVNGIKNASTSTGSIIADLNRSAI